MGNAREIHRNNNGVNAGQLAAEPPALPPRPLVENHVAVQHHHHHQDERSNGCSPCSRKYVLLCAACGGLAIILGSLFAVLYFVLRSYTSSLHYFETVPSYVASVVVNNQKSSSKSPSPLLYISPFCHKKANKNQ